MFDHILFYPAAAAYYAACLGWVVLLGIAAMALRRRRIGAALVMIGFSVAWCGAWVYADRESSQPNRRLASDFNAIRTGMSPRQVQQVLGLPTAVKHGDDVPMVAGLPHAQPWFLDHDQLIYRAQARPAWSHPLPHWPFWRVEPFYDCPWLTEWFADRFTLSYLRHVHSRPRDDAEPLYLVSIDATGQVVAKHIWPPPPVQKADPPVAAASAAR